MVTEGSGYIQENEIDLKCTAWNVYSPESHTKRVSEACSQLGSSVAVATMYLLKWGELAKAELMGTEAGNDSQLVTPVGRFGVSVDDVFAIGTII